MKSLTELFNGAILRIPDYQRGYAWERDELQDFWKDLSWLAEGQRHYTGLIALNPLLEQPDLYPPGTSLYHVVDGQQRLTTCVLLLAKLIARRQGDFIGENLKSIIREKYLFKTTSTASIPIFGYDDDDSMKFLTAILERGRLGTSPHTVYQRNLLYANDFLNRQLNNLSQENLDSTFTTLTTRLVFDLHEVSSDFDVCAMFESINYRGKKLTKFEVLKNRLIYLNELLGQIAQDRHAEFARRREQIYKCWGQCFRIFGQDQEDILDEDEFLINHSIMYFGPLDRERDALDKRLFKEQWSPDRLRIADNPLTTREIEAYVANLETSAQLWAIQQGYEESAELGADLLGWLGRLDRLGTSYFKPIVLAALNWCWSRLYPHSPQGGEAVRDVIALVKAIERFVFVVFEVGDRRSDFGSAYFLQYAHEIFQERAAPKEVAGELQSWVDGVNENGYYTGAFFPRAAINAAKARFLKGQGYHSWAPIKYLLGEFREYLGDRMLSRKEYINNSVERVMPQNPDGDGEWTATQKALGERAQYYVDDLGNLTLLPRAANKSAQDISLRSKAAAYNGQFSLLHNKCQILI